MNNKILPGHVIVRVILSLEPEIKYRSNLDDDDSKLQLNLIVCASTSSMLSTFGLAF